MFTTLRRIIQDNALQTDRVNASCSQRLTCQAWSYVRIGLQLLADISRWQIENLKPKVFEVTESERLFDEPADFPVETFHRCVRGLAELPVAEDAFHVAADRTRHRR